MNNKIKKLSRILAVLAIGLVYALGWITPVQAIDSSPTLKIGYVNAYQNMITSGDMAFLVDFTVDYPSGDAPLSSEPISSTYLIRFMNGSIQASSIAPVDFFNNGYAQGCIMIYFSPVQVILNSLTWNSTSYKVRLDGNPLANWTGTGNIPPYASPSAITNWETSNSIQQTDKQLCTDILYESTALTLDWSNSSYVLSTFTAGTSYLTSTGSNYFTQTIYGFNTACASIMPSQSLPITPNTPMATPLAYANSIGSDVQGTQYSIGTASIANGSTSVTGTNGTLWTSTPPLNMTLGWIKFGSDYNWYQIQSVGGTTALTLATPYMGSTQTNASYTILYVQGTAPLNQGNPSPLNLLIPASALHITATIFGVLISLLIMIFVGIHGSKEANSYRVFILVEFPLLYVFVRIGWVPMVLAVLLGIFAAVLTYYVIFYEKTIQ